MLQGASNPAVSLVGTAIAAPLILPNPAAAPADYTAVVLTADVAVADGTCQLASGSTVHVSTRFAAVSDTAAAAAAAEAAAATERLMAQCSEPLATEYAYRQLASAGLQYGPSFRLLRGIKRGGSAAAAAVRQPAAQLPAEFVLNPAVLDCCLQLGGMVPAQQAAGSQQDGNTYIPASLAVLCAGSGVPRIGWQAAVALAQRPAGATDTPAAVLRNHSIVGAAGALVCQLDGLESKSTGAKGRAAGAAGRAAAAPTPDMLYEIHWEAADPAAAQPDVAASSSYSSLSLASAGLPLAAASIAALQGALVGAAASLQLQTRAGHAAIAMPTAASAASEAAGQMWGLLRTTAAECQGMAVSGADQDALASGAMPPAQLVLGGKALAAFDGYGSTAAGGSRFLPFMQPSAAHSTPAPFQLLPQPRGALQNLVPVPVQAADVPAGQELVAVKAVGINFR